MKIRHWALAATFMLAVHAQAKVSVSEYKADGAATPGHSPAMLVYISGIVAGVYGFNAMLKVRGQPQIFCPPENLDSGPQLGIAVIDGALGRHPAIKETNEIASLLPFALEETFPCK